MLIVMDKSTQEKHSPQPLQTHIKQIKIAVTFLSAYNGVFNVTDKDNKFNFANTISDKDGFIQISISPGAHEIESLNNEIRRIIIEWGYGTETDYPLTIKPNFSTLGSIIEISRHERLISFFSDDSIRKF